jgi:hypothetical protein
MSIFISTQMIGAAMLLIFMAFWLLSFAEPLAGTRGRSTPKGWRAMAVTLGLVGVFLLTWQA